MNRKRHCGIIILGGGLAGLAAAHELEERGFPDYTILEAASRPGGLLRTNREEGVEIDEIPHVFFTRDEKAMDIFMKMSGPLCSHRHKLGVLWRKGKFVDYPFQNHIYQLNAEERQIALRGLLERRAGGGKIRNLEDYALKTLGGGIVDLFFRPYNEKLWKTPLKKMDHGWLSSKIKMPDASALARSVLGGKNAAGERVAPHAEFFYPKKGGIESLAEGLARRAGEERILLKANVLKIDAKKKSVFTTRGEFAYKRLISTLPLPEVIRLAGIGGVRDAWRRFAATRVLCVQYVLREVNLPSYHWIYVPGEKFPFYRLTRVDLFNPSAAPGFRVLLAECSLAPGGRGEKKIAASCTERLAKMGIIKKRDVERTWTFSHWPAYPVQHAGIGKDRERFRAILKKAGVATAGRFAEWGLFNMDHTINSALKAAGEAAESLGLVKK